jgi:flagellin
MSLFSINTNLGALAALQSLDQTQQALTEAQNEVSTGQSVGNAAANPAIYSISNTINANIAGLSAVSDSLNFGAQIVATASSGIGSISSVLANLQQTVTSSGTTGINLTTLQAAVSADLTSIDEFASKATFNGVNLLDPAVASGNSGSLNVVQGLDGSVYTIANQGSAVYTGSGAATSLTQALGISGLNVTQPGIQVSFNDSLALGSFSSASSLTNPLASGNAVFQLTTGAGTASSPSETYNFEFTDANNSTVTTLQSAQTNSATANSQVIDVAIDTSSQSTNQIIGALVSAIRGAGFAVSQNTDGSLNISGADPTSGAAIASASFGSVDAGTLGGSNITETATSTTAQNYNGVSIVGSAEAATTNLVSTVQSAITAANSISATLGAATDQITGLQSFTSSLSSALTAGVGALTDADLAAESAKLTSLQTKQQLATQSLSIANKQPQSLLTLFQGL